MKRLCYLGILKEEGFSAYSNVVMLISRKMTKDKRVVTDFRYLNMCITKNNLVYPLLKDTLAMLGSLQCEVMSVLDLKDAFHSLKFKDILWHPALLWECFPLVSEDAYGPKHLSSNLAIIH